ncbi:hypothetical protein OAO01_04015 [Oligoflexia bacterium]|nr:hypothetical protein [Oligoflexia bacterium]
MDSDTINTIKAQVLAALQHPEADEGLYFRNFTLLHEEDERPRVVADEVDILDALHALIEEGKVQLDESQEEAIFQLIEAG